MDVKKMILAVLLSIGVWFVWMKFFAPAPTPTVQETKESATQKQTVEKQAKDTLSEIKVVNQNANNETLIDTVTDKYSVTLSNRGGVIKSFKYKGRNVELVVPKNKFKAKGVFDFSVYFSKEEFMHENPLDNVIWDHRKISENVIKFSTNLLLNGKPILLEKIYTFYKENDYFKLDYNIVNYGNKALSFPNGQIIISPGDFLGPDMDFESTYNKLNPIYYNNGDFNKVEKGGGFFSKGESFKTESGDIKWAGLMSRYFLLIMLPENFSGTGIICDTREHTGYRPGIYVNAKNLEPGGKLSKSFKIYAGEKEKDKLAAVDISLKDAADVSKWIEPIRDFLLWCLMKINLLFGNFGWSLVVFSILSKIVLLPLTIKSTDSMKKMQALSPKMAELKEKYKGKPELLNKEMMKMYKVNKVNPMGGCLPLILQMPFFFALWSALINSIDLWQAPFIFWIKDLSMPDTVAQVFGYNLNILPILMTATSFIQQKMMPSAGSGQQQKMMMLMPLVFIVIFWNMPSGLVLYWTLQNTMQILHQLYSNRKPVQQTQ
ncbi:MAG: membrane protein insertase YidC [Spirochaetota bacterium]